MCSKLHNYLCSRLLHQDLHSLLHILADRGLSALPSGKIVFWLCLFAVSWAGTSKAQQAASNSSAASSAEISLYTVAEKGSHHRIWKRVVAETNSAGSVLYRTNVFTELATGLNHQVGNQWVASSDDIQLTPNGGAATNTQHQVYFSANINIKGSIDVVTPQGRELTGTGALGMSLYDSSSGQKRAIIAQVQDSIGQILTSSNHVLYTNALTDSASGLQADVLYTHKRNGSGTGRNSASAATLASKFRLESRYHDAASLD